MLEFPADQVVCVVGAGYVGTVTAAGLAGLGRDVRLVEIDPIKRSLISSGRSPLHEPGLDALIEVNVNANRLQAVDSLADGVRGAGIIIVAVGTPATNEGLADLSQVDAVVSEVVEYGRPGMVLVLKSTVPPGTTNSVARRMAAHGIAVVACPEFLREGSAVRDFNEPTRLVIGGDDEAARQRVAALFAPTGSRQISATVRVPS